MDSQTEGPNGCHGSPGTFTRGTVRFLSNSLYEVQTYGPSTDCVTYDRQSHNLGGPWANAVYDRARSTAEVFPAPRPSISPMETTAQGGNSDPARTPKQAATVRIKRVSDPDYLHFSLLLASYRGKFYAPTGMAHSNASFYGVRTGEQFLAQHQAVADGRIHPAELSKDIFIHGNTASKGEFVEFSLGRPGVPEVPVDQVFIRNRLDDSTLLGRLTKGCEVQLVNQKGEVIWQQSLEYALKNMVVTDYTPFGKQWDGQYMVFSVP